MKDKTLLRRRRWLRPNKGWSTQSASHSYVELSRYKNGLKTLSGSICFRDCSSNTSFEFDADNERSFELQLEAMEVLLEELSLLLEAWERGHDIIKAEGGWKPKEKK